MAMHAQKQKKINPAGRQPSPANNSFRSPHPFGTSLNDTNDTHSADTMPGFEIESPVAPHIGHHFADLRVHAAVPETIQTELTINQPGDVYEQEAERVAEQVIQMETPASSEAPSTSQNARLGADDLFTRKEASDTSVHETASAPPLVDEVLSSGVGQPLDESTCSFMESRFGHDFSRVRVHTDERAAESARAVNALAYTAGQDVVFGEGQYAPGTSEGKKLLAHELTHVVQQSSAEMQVDQLVSDPAASAEQEAIAISGEIDGQVLLSPVAAPTALIHRAPPGSPDAPAVPPLSEGEKEEQQKIEKALQSNDLGNALYARNFSHATEEQKIGLIRILLNKGSGAAEVQEQIKRIWASFADLLPSVAERYMPEWQQSANITPLLMNLPVVKKIQDAFKDDIAQVVTDNLFANRQALLERKKMHGLGDAKSLTDSQYKELRVSIQDMAYHVWELKQAQNKLKNTTIGYPMAVQATYPMKFGPERKPDLDPNHYLEILKWDDLKVAWDATAEEIARIAGRYPEIYAALAADKPEEELLYLSRVIPEAFSGKIGQLLDELLERVDDIQFKLTNKKIGVLDLQPVHERLFQGLSVASGRGWGTANSFDQWTAKRLLSEHEQNEKAIKFLLSAVEITALMVASFATAGSLTFFVAAAIAIGPPAVQGVIDWREAAKQDEMAKATPLQGTELITQVKADATKAQAVSELVRALINAITLGVPTGIKAATGELQVERIASKGAIALSSELVGTDEALAQGASLIKSQPGMYDVIVHGSSDSFGVLHGEEWIQVNHRSLALYMSKTGYTGGPVRLISCETAAGRTPIAQDLANKLGAEVTAPMDRVYIWSDGSLTTGPNEYMNTNAWKTFTPGGTP